MDDKFHVMGEPNETLIRKLRGEASDEPAKKQRGLDELIERRSDRALYYLDQIWVPLKGDVRTLTRTSSSQPPSWTCSLQTLIQEIQAFLAFLSASQTSQLQSQNLLSTLDSWPSEESYGSHTNELIDLTFLRLLGICKVDLPLYVAHLGANVNANLLSHPSHKTCGVDNGYSCNVLPIPVPYNLVLYRVSTASMKYIARIGQILFFISLSSELVLDHCLPQKRNSIEEKLVWRSLCFVSGNALGRVKNSKYDWCHSIFEVLVPDSKLSEIWLSIRKEVLRICTSGYLSNGYH
ncbi:hypothetical protein Tco_0345139 [Tanacetum coccineum]